MTRKLLAVALALLVGTGASAGPLRFYDPESGLFAPGVPEGVTHLLRYDSYATMMERGSFTRIFELEYYPEGDVNVMNGSRVRHGIENIPASAAQGLRNPSVIPGAAQQAYEDTKLLAKVEIWAAERIGWEKVAGIMRDFGRIGGSVGVLTFGYDLLFGSMSGVAVASDNSYWFEGPEGPTQEQQAACLRWGSCAAHDKTIDDAKAFRKTCLRNGGELGGGGTTCRIPMPQEVLECRAGGGTMNPDGTCTPKGPPPPTPTAYPWACADDEVATAVGCVLKNPRGRGQGEHSDGGSSEIIGQWSGWWMLPTGRPTAPDGPGCTTGPYFSGSPAPPCE